MERVAFASEAFYEFHFAHWAYNFDGGNVAVAGFVDSKASGAGLGFAGFIVLCDQQSRRRHRSNAGGVRFGAKSGDGLEPASCGISERGDWGDGSDFEQAGDYVKRYSGGNPRGTPAYLQGDEMAVSFGSGHWGCFHGAGSGHVAFDGPGRGWIIAGLRAGADEFYFWHRD